MVGNGIFTYSCPSPVWPGMVLGKRSSLTSFLLSNRESRPHRICSALAYRQAAWGTRIWVACLQVQIASWAQISGNTRPQGANMACENLKETTGMQMPGERDDQLKSQLDQPKEKKVKTVRESKIFKSSLVYWGTGKIAPAQPREDTCPENTRRPSPWAN